jgi:hypothetical protein
MTNPNVDIVIDCHNIELLLDFWAAALDYRKIGSKDQYGLLMPEDPAHPPVILQRVPEPKTSKTRVHFDLRVDDVVAKANELEALGARRMGCRLDMQTAGRREPHPRMPPPPAVSSSDRPPHRRRSFPDRTLRSGSVVVRQRAQLARLVLVAVVGFGLLTRHSLVMQDHHHGSAGHSGGWSAEQIPGSGCCDQPRRGPDPAGTDLLHLCLAVLIGVASVLAAFAFISLRHNRDGWLLPACGNPVRSRSRAPPGTRCHLATLCVLRS